MATKRKTEDDLYQDALRMLSPGSMIREAISYIIQALRLKPAKLP